MVYGILMKDILEMVNHYKTVGYEYKEFLSDDAVFVEIDQFFLQYFQTTL
jgi:hypothetical protein